jgi:hypothetical protein
MTWGMTDSLIDSTTEPVGGGIFLDDLNRIKEVFSKFKDNLFAANHLETN